MTTSGGYTLLEMVVVMAVLALATAIVGPSGYRMVQSWREADGVESAIRSIEALPVQAQAQGTEFRLEGDIAPSQGLVDMPEGWRLQMDQPLMVRANGACADASAVLVTTRQQIALTIQGPFCQVRRNDVATP